MKARPHFGVYPSVTSQMATRRMRPHSNGRRDKRCFTGASYRLKNHARIESIHVSSH